MCSNEAILMSTHNIPFSKQKEESHLTIPNLQPGDFSKELKNESETAVVNEPSVFEPLKFYCITDRSKVVFLLLLLTVVHVVICPCVCFSTIWSPE